MTAIIYRPRSRAEVVRLLAQREEIEEMQRAVVDWTGGAAHPLHTTAPRAGDSAYEPYSPAPGKGEWRPLRWQDRVVIVGVCMVGCALWLGIIWYAARGGWR